jgi:hypothetical protein
MFESVSRKLKFDESLTRQTSALNEDLRKAVPDTFQKHLEVDVARISVNRHVKVVRLSALRTGRLCPKGKIPGTHFR